MGPDTGRVKVTVDGKDAGTRQQVDPWSYYQRLAAIPLASGLPDGEHTVTIELLPDPPVRTVPIESAKKAGRYDPKLFDGVALRIGCLRLLGEPIHMARPTVRRTSPERAIQMRDEANARSADE